MALCSKTYHAFNQTSTKIACKGLQKRVNKSNLTLERYLAVLERQAAGAGTNRGIRAVNGHVVTYKTIRNGLSYLYVKRVIQADGVSTKTLDI